MTWQTSRMTECHGLKASEEMGWKLGLMTVGPGPVKGCHSRSETQGTEVVINSGT